MDETKTWYQSKTIWGGLVAIAGTCGSLAGWDLRAGDAAGLVEALTATATAAGGLLAIVGRITARKTLR